MMPVKFPRIVILGAAGFIGYHLANEYLSSSKAELLLIDNFIRGKNDTEFSKLVMSPRVQFYDIDLTNLQAFVALIKENDLVINLAAFNGTENFYERPLDVIIHSGLTSINVAIACANARVNRLIYMGSSESYAGGVDLGVVEIPTKEEVPLVIPNVQNPRWSYAGSKTIGELSCFAAHKQHNLQFQIFRLHNIYGPRMGDRHVIPELIRRFSSGNGVVYGMEQTRSFLYVTDAVRTIKRCIDADLRINNITNIGAESEIRIQNLAELIRDFVKPELKLVPSPAYEGSVLRRRPDIESSSSLNCKGDTTLSDGLQKTINWYLKND